MRKTFFLTTMVISPFCSEEYSRSVLSWEMNTSNLNLKNHRNDQYSVTKLKGILYPQATRSTIVMPLAAFRALYPLLRRNVGMP